MLSSTARRREMLWRKGIHCCARCGQPLAGPHQATLEHIVLKSAGGRTTRSNLTLSHAQCNQKAGHALWRMMREIRADAKRDRTFVPAAFWYEGLLAPASSSRVAP